MKLNHLTIENLIGLSHVDTDLPTAVSVFAGANHAGKSSVREAIRAALLGMPERVLKKKDLLQLVHDGQKHGSVIVEFDNEGQATFVAPKGAQALRHGLTMSEWESQELVLPYCLDPAAFARASADERRNLLFALTGAGSKPEDIVAAMRERGLTDAVIDAVTPMMRAGFPGMAKLAEERCRDAKASWKAVTGETYGRVKAEDWAAPEGAQVDEAELTGLQTRVDELKHRIANGRTELGAAEQRLRAWQDATENREADEKAAARLEAAQAKLKRDTAELQKWTDEVKRLEHLAGAGGPRSGLIHDMARALDGLISEPQPQGVDRPSYVSGLQAMQAYEEQHGPLDVPSDPQAVEKLPEARKARDLMRRCAENDERDIEAAQTAVARLQRNVERGSEEEVERIRESLRTAEKDLATASADLSALQSERRKADQAQLRTQKAAAAHREAQDWQAAIDALSPAGIPSDVLGKSIGPVNRILAGLVGVLNFPRVRIDSDIAIYADERPYVLLSESERWRADAQIALTLAGLSGLRMVALDRFDILDLPARADCIAGLDALAAAGKIDTALVFGTFKKLPAFGALEHVTGYWIESGRITETTAVEEVAIA